MVPADLLKRLTDVAGTAVMFAGAGVGIVAAPFGWMLWLLGMPLVYSLGLRLHWVPWPAFLLLWLAGIGGSVFVPWAVLRRYPLSTTGQAMGFVGLGGLISLAAFGLGMWPWTDFL